MEEVYENRPRNSSWAAIFNPYRDTRINLSNLYTINVRIVDDREEKSRLRNIVET